MKHKTIIIAEAGVNHNGKIELAYELIDSAVHAGADIIKFQTYKTENIVTRSADKPAYQKTNTPSDESQFELLKTLELGYDEFSKLKEYCDQKGILFLASCDFESIEFLIGLGTPYFKISSGDVTNRPYLEKVAGFNKEVFLSTGMSDLSEIEAAIKVLTENGTARDNIWILHCNTEYPTPFEHVHLRAMSTIHDSLGIKVGYSDHTIGIEVPVAAVAMGAGVIEKHFTLDRDLPGPDHRTSLEPHELKEMVGAIRNIEKALGSKEKLISPSAAANKQIVRKSIVASVKILKGKTYTPDNLCIRRPGTGISPMRWYEIIGKKADVDYEKDDLINEPGE